MADLSLNTALKAHLGVRPEWLAQVDEPIVEPELVIVDPHHHAWDPPGNRYLFDDIRADMAVGHNIAASVFVQCFAMYRADGPDSLKPVGETEFVNGIAAQSASGAYGATRICKGIVPFIDLSAGAAAEALLDAHERVAGVRFKGVRPVVAWHEDPGIRALDVGPRVLSRPASREAIGLLSRRNLSLDLWAVFTQLDEVADLCRAFPDLTVVVDHLGGPLGIGEYSGKREEVLVEWRKAIANVAQYPNAVIKLGGLGMRYAGFALDQKPMPPTSDQLVGDWRPYIEHAIESFGPERCMFESNFPIDKGMFSYTVVWNTFKKLSTQYSADERAWLFSRTSAKTYNLDK